MIPTTNTPDRVESESQLNESEPQLNKSESRLNESESQLNEKCSVVFEDSAEPAVAVSTQKPKMSFAAKLSAVVAIVCTVAVIVLELLGFSSALNEELANFIALPLLATAALFGGIQSYFRSRRVPSVFSTAVFQFAAATVLYLCCIVILVIRFNVS